MLVFLDLKKAYDSVPRSLLLSKLAKAGIQHNLIKLLANIFSQTEVTFDGEGYCRVDTGLPQGSSLSPVLFNFFINDLIKELEGKDLFVKAYADDLVVGIKQGNQLDLVLSIVQSWCSRNDISLNPSKSGIMRILKRKGKCKGIRNRLQIPEVAQYKYLGVIIGQSFKLQCLGKELRRKERPLLKKARALGNSNLSTA